MVGEVFNDGLWTQGRVARSANIKKKGFLSFVFVFYLMPSVGSFCLLVLWFGA
jgi:hypothetical protein